MAVRSVEILDDEAIFDRWIIHWRRVKFRHSRFIGAEAKTSERLVLEWGDSVGILIHDTAKDEVVLVEQLRIATEATGGWILEIPAGKVDAGEKPRQAAIREAQEETGAVIANIEHISSFYLSPGISTERLHLYYCPLDAGFTIDRYTGIADEDEDIQVRRMPLGEALGQIARGQIVDAKSILALFWLKIRMNGR